MTEDLDYRKSAILLFNIEKSMCNYVKKQDLSDQRYQQVLSSVRGRNGRRGVEDDLDLISYCYMEEVLQLFILACKANGKDDSANRFFSLFNVLQVAEIRNSCAHPAREFPKSYWYCVAALASDSSLQKIGLVDPIKTLAAVEDGVIGSPPDGWLDGFVWELPNNIPDNLDHLETGLIGRKEVRSRLVKLICSERFIPVALVARGGIGKTALACEILKDLASTPSIADLYDSIVYCTFKVDFLGVSGVVRNADVDEMVLSAGILDSLFEVYGGSYGSLGEAFEIVGRERILLCIDNAETLISKDLDSFMDVMDSLPSSWRVLITSRVSVDGFRTVAVPDLEENDLFVLAQKYSRSKSVSIGRENVERLARSQKGNPLALKLAIDYISIGNDIKFANSTAASMIAQFSYEKLVDALSEVSVHILEVVFLRGESGRSDLISLTGFDSDLISSGISELSRTSLVVRDLDGFEERISLNDSVREFVRGNNRNLSIRSKVNGFVNKAVLLAKNASELQSQRGVSKDSIYFVPSDLPLQMQNLAFETNSAVKRASKVGVEAVSAVLTKYEGLKEALGNKDTFWRFYARAMWSVDKASAVGFIKRAVEINGASPQNRAVLGWYLSSTNDVDGAIEVFEQLEADGWADISRVGRELYSYIVNGMLKAYLYGSKYSEIIKRTECWRLNDSLPILSVMRINALRQNSFDISDKVIYFDECVEISMDCHSRHGYSRELVNASWRLCKDVLYAEKNFPGKLDGRVFDGVLVILRTMKSSGFVAELDLALSSYNVDMFSSSGYIDRIRSMFNLVSDDGGSFDDVEDIFSADSGFIRAEIDNPPRSRSNSFDKYLFAQDRSGRRFFVSVDVVMNCNWSRWGQLRRGGVIYIKFVEPVVSDKSPEAIQAYIV